VKIIDITREIKSAPIYPGSDPVKVEKLTEMEKGDLFTCSLITVGSHMGTHADAFAHFIMGGKTIEKMELDHYYGKCVVVTTPEDMPVYKKDLEGKIEGYERIVLHTGKGYLTKEAAQYLVEAGVKTVVTDYWSIAPLDNEKEIHEIILGNGVAAVESVVLDGVEDGEYILSAFPIKIEGCDGGFVRAVLIKEK